MKLLSESTTVAMNAIARQKKLNGEEIFNFSAGDPLIENHPSILSRAMDQIKKGFFPYPPPEGIPELRKLAAEWMNDTCKTNFGQNNVLVTCGGKFALFVLLYSLLQPLDEVLIPAPYWVSYPDLVKMTGGVPKILQTTLKTSWKLTPENLLQSITEKSKFLIFNNACNPTGTLYTKQEINVILKIAKKHQITVISDEVYSGLAYEEPGFISCGEISDEALIIQSCSKNFGMTGWRVGFVLAPERIIKQLIPLQTQSTTGVSTICQWAAVGALENAAEVTSYVKTEMKSRRDVFSNIYPSLFRTALGKIPSGLYAFVPLSDLGCTETSAAFCERMIASHNISLVPGSAFGMEGYVRFSFSDSEINLISGLNALRTTLKGNL